MVNLSGLFRKATRVAHSSPDAVRAGVDKVQSALNTRTKGKYADHLAKGSDVIDKALGVPGQTRDAYRKEAGAPKPQPDPVKADPVNAPEEIDPARPV